MVTVKIRDSALGLYGFVSFFLVGVSAGGAYRKIIYSYVLCAYLTKLISLGGVSAGGRRYHGFLRYSLLEEFGANYCNSWFSFYRGEEESVLQRL